MIWKKVEADFLWGEKLPPHLISDILTIIDECFVKNLMKDNRLIAKFGSSADSYTKALNDYKVDILNALTKWQTKYKASHGKLDMNLQGRAAYTLRYDDKGNSPQPLLTFSYILALDMIFKHIPKSIREVCPLLSLLVLPICATSHDVLFVASQDIHVLHPTMQQMTHHRRLHVRIPRCQ